MITFKPVVYAHQRRSDGTWNVKVKITYKRKARHLHTNIFCNANDLTRSLKIKSLDIITKCNRLCDQMREAVSQLSLFELEAHDVDWVVAYIRRTLTEEVFRLDFFEFADAQLADMGDSTRKKYITALNAFESYLKVRKIDINDITSSTVVGLKDYLDKRKKVCYAGRLHRYIPSDKERKNNRQTVVILSSLNSLFNMAKAKFNDSDDPKQNIPRSPFSGKVGKLPASSGQKNLGVELMQKIIDCEDMTPSRRRALDIFIVSFGLMGMNMADLYKCRMFRDTLEYERSKTRGRRRDNAYMKIDIPSQLEPFLARLRTEDDTFLVPALREYASKDNATRGVNRGLRSVQRVQGWPDFTFYAARHTWASLARKAGVDKATIDECLAHVGNFEMADIYADRDWEVINEANSRTLALLKWK